MRRSQIYYKLEGRRVVETDLMGWANSREVDEGRRVAKTELQDHWISTVFLGIDHSFGDGPPLVFESMAFRNGSWSEQDCERYATYEEAEAGHLRMVEKFQLMEAMRR